jgi:hypothetical protein
MSYNNKDNRPRRGAWLATLLLTAGVAFTAGTMLRPPRDAAADVRATPAPEAFKSGGERSELVLKEVLSTLKTMDGRLKRIETVVVEGKK